jgi:ADP-ribose pyrophosphatase YjhB (NUDIX family)
VALPPSALFRYCPRCGAERSAAPDAAAPFRCPACGFLYFFNPAIAVAAIVVDPHRRALFIRRAREPARGKLAMPGGFVDIGETAEQALRREVREETGLELGLLHFLSSHPNTYHYEEVAYPVVDLFFVAAAENHERALALDEVASIAWEDPATVDLDEVAFPSMRDALERYRAGLPRELR